MADQAEKVFKMMANSPIPQMLQSLGMAVAEAQYSMDRYVMKAIKELAASENAVELPNGQSKSMLELGLLPSFYHFSEINLNIKLAITSMEGEEYGVGASIGANYKVFAATLNASYSNKYSFSADASSEVNTKIVSIPAPPELKEILQNYVNSNK